MHISGVTGKSANSDACVKPAKGKGRHNSHEERAERGGKKMQGLAQFEIADAGEQDVTDNGVEETPKHVDQRARQPFPGGFAKGL